MRKKNRTSQPSLWARCIERLPLAAIAGLAGFTAAAMVLLLLDRFSTELVWGVGLAAALLCAWGVFWFGGVKERPGGKREWIICDILLLVGVAAWGWWNVQLTAQHVFTDRDPATYAVTASWLAQHDDLVQQDTELTSVDGLRTNSAGFYMDQKTDRLYPQGQHALPVLLGAIGKFVGPVMLLHFNVLFGMTALLAVYCFARLFMASRWALVATAVVGCSLPLIYFSRDTYTEPLALTFTFGGLALLAGAVQSRKLWLWGVAGLTFSASLLARIDAYLALVGVAAFMAIYVALAARGDRWRRVREWIVFAVPVAAMAALAWFDLKLLSPAYYESTESLITLELMAVGGVVTAGVLLWIVFFLWPKARRGLDALTKKWRPAVAATLVLVAAVFLASLPLWWQSTVLRENEVVAQLQQQTGLEVDAYQRYTELAPYWVSWYVGPVIAALGAAGLAYGMYRAMREKNLLLLAGLFVVLGTALVYFWQPNITPDQIWASRRMLPVVIPGVVIFGVFAIAEIMKRMKLSRYMKSVAYAAAAGGLILAPLITSAPFLNERMLRQYDLIAGVCDNLPDNAVVTWIGVGRLVMVQPTRTYCGVEAYNFQYKREDAPTREKLAEISQAVREQGKVPVLAVFRDQYGGLIDELNQRGMSEVGGAEYKEMVRTLITPPTQLEERWQGAALGIIEADGSIVRIGQ